MQPIHIGQALVIDLQGCRAKFIMSVRDTNTAQTSLVVNQGLA